MDVVDQRLMCPSCQCIFREPYRLSCGHRLCQSCLHTQTEWALLLRKMRPTSSFVRFRAITCSLCSITSATSEVSIADPCWPMVLRFSFSDCVWWSISKWTRTSIAKLCWLRLDWIFVQLSSAALISNSTVSLDKSIFIFRIIRMKFIHQD